MNLYLKEILFRLQQIQSFWPPCNISQGGCMYWQFMRYTEKCAAYQKQICRGLDCIPEVVRKLFIKTNDMVYFKAALFSLPTTIYQTLAQELRKTYPM